MPEVQFSKCLAYQVFKNAFPEASMSCKNTGCGCIRKSSHLLGTESINYNSYDSSFVLNLSKFSIYGILNGFSGSSAATFAAQQIPSCIVLDGTKHDNALVDFKEVLYNSFLETDKLIFTYLNKEEQRSGTSAVVAIVNNDVLHIANVGNCHALLCKTDSEGVMRVVELSYEHNVKNEDEILRLKNSGVEISEISNGELIDDQYVTRCLGNSDIKINFKNLAAFKNAKTPPVIADPELCSYSLDETCRFLVLASNSLYRYMINCATNDEKNKSIVKLIVDEFPKYTSLDDIAQAVVENVIKEYSESFGCSEDGGKEAVCVIIRNFNYPLKDTSRRTNMLSNPVSLYINTSEHPLNSDPGDLTPVATPSSTESTDSFMTKESLLSVDENGLIKPYVDFSNYYNLVDEAKSNGTLPVGIDF